MTNHLDLSIDAHESGDHRAATSQLLMWASEVEALDRPHRRASRLYGFLLLSMGVVVLIAGAMFVQLRMDLKDVRARAEAAHKRCESFDEALKLRTGGGG